MTHSPHLNSLKIIRKFLRSLLVLCLVPLVCIAFLIVLLLLIFPCVIYRYAVYFAAKYISRIQFGKMVTSIGTIIASSGIYTERALSIVAMLEFEGSKLTYECMRKRLIEDMVFAKDPATGNVMYPELTSTIMMWMGYLFFVHCPNFEPNKHIFRLEETTIPQPDWTDCDALEKLTAYLVRSRIWTEDKPVWEAIFVSNVPPRHLTGGEARNSVPGNILIYKQHHVLSDGFQLLKMLIKLGDDPNVLRELPQIKSNKRSFVGSALFCARIPFEMTSAVLSSIMSSKVKMPIADNEKQYTDISIGNLDVFPIKFIKDTKNKFRVDFNAVILSGITTAVRRKFEEQGLQIPKNVKIMFPYPVPGHRDKLRNHITVGSIWLPTGETDSVQRLFIVASRLRKLKGTSLPLIAFIMSRLFGTIPSSFYAFIRNHKQSNAPPLLLTNLFGPPCSTTAEGSALLGIRGGSNITISGPNGLAYGVGMISFNGMVRFGATGFSRYFPSHQDARDFAQYCFDEWERLSGIQVV